VIHADDTPVKGLAPGNGKTKTGRFWAYLRDERPHGGSALPAVVYHYTPDRKGEHCRAHLASFSGHLHADGYQGFAQLYRRADAKPGPVIEVGCWSHARRLFFDVHASNGWPPGPPFSDITRQGCSWIRAVCCATHASHDARRFCAGDQSTAQTLATGRS